MVVSVVGMYLRTIQRRRKDGSLVRYLQLAHNRRVGGVTRAEVLLQLGREDELDVEGLRRLGRSSRRRGWRWSARGRLAAPGCWMRCGGGSVLPRGCGVCWARAGSRLTSSESSSRWWRI